MMRFAMAVNQVCCAATDAVSIYAVDHGLLDVRVVCQAEIIIAAKADDVFTINHHLYLLRTICDAA